MSELVAVSVKELKGIDSLIDPRFGRALGFVIVNHATGEIVAEFHNSGEMGHLFLYDVTGIPAPILAMMVAAMAAMMFLGAERVERIYARKRDGEEPEPAEKRPRTVAFATFGGLAVIALATLLVPATPRAAPAADVGSITPAELAHRVLDDPWGVRVIDLRAADECARQRVPGAECVPQEQLGDIGLAYGPGVRDLVLVADARLEKVPEAATAYRGRVAVLAGGMAAWRAYALTPPAPPGHGAAEADREAYRLRTGLHAALTGTRQAPPPAPGKVQKYVPKPKKRGGGCS